MKMRSVSHARSGHVKAAAHSRRGAILIWVTAMMLVILGFAALAVDVGHLYVVQADLQLAADSAALAAAEGLTQGVSAARQRAIEYAGKNAANGAPVTVTPADVEFGIWNTVSHTFTPIATDANGPYPDAVRVTTQLNESSGNSVGLHFARALGLSQANVGASAVAYYRARDIAIVLDYSASMNDDSELGHVNSIGHDALYANFYQMWIELGAPQYGNMQFDPVFINSNSVSGVRAQLGLNNVAYPYPSGSWNDFISHVMNSNSVNNAGYRKKYGYLTLIDYWLVVRPMNSETPDLWQVSAQPITAVKNAVALFLSYLQQVETNDQVGLVSYTYSDGTAKLESALTGNFNLIESTSMQLQAGHYDHYTNIGAGILKARQELNNNGRPGTFKMIVLLTDGIANRPSNATVGRQYTIDQATAAQIDGIPILTISLGASADTELMQDVADITGGVHFNVPGGQSVNAYTEDLMNVFRDVADHRPLKLVR
jgi:Flp pilus assembly protein TadG